MITKLLGLCDLDLVKDAIRSIKNKREVAIRSNLSCRSSQPIVNCNPYTFVRWHLAVYDFDGGIVVHLS